MFRIRKIFENELTAIFKVEGSIGEDNLRAWAEEIDRMTQTGIHQTVLECSSVSSICQEGRDILFGHLSEKVYLVNCPVGVTNSLHAAGRSGNVLD